MKTHTANYFDTFIEVADDTKAEAGTPPPVKEKKTVAAMQYELLRKNPYRYTSDDILFQVYADRNEVDKGDYTEVRKVFFSKGQSCFRASPLTKNYGFGIHSDSNGKIALYGMETKEYQKFMADSNVKKVKAMRSQTK
ncbi:MAG: hypothetical protein ITF99_00925 [Chryseobacterium sp.]|nr:hypothetical protein [Chryseobacterium sp.]